MDKPRGDKESFNKFKKSSTSRGMVSFDVYLWMQSQLPDSFSHLPQNHPHFFHRSPKHHEAEDHSSLERCYL